MQLIKYLLTIILIVNFSVLAQDKNIDNNKKPVEIDFLMNYYNQTGNHSAVTGGIGSENLSDIGPQITINIPMQNSNSLSLILGFDTYTSASTDNVDPATVSGASRQDLRVHVDADYTFNPSNNRNSYGFNLGLSREYDYLSTSFGGHWSTISQDGNREFNISGKYFYDKITVIEPIELRNPKDFNADEDEWNYNSDFRKTFILSLTYSFVISQRAQASISTDIAYQTGLLSTPFHRVFFNGVTKPKNEKFPTKRLKIPIGFRFNYFINDYIIARLFYRYYHDDFGIDGNTLSIETPLRFSNKIAIIPFYRYHTQTKASFFKGSGQHIISENFYSSDYDLSAFHSNKFGFGFRYYPLWGITTLKFPIINNLEIQKFELRFAKYNRSDGLSAFSISLGFGMIIR